MDKLREIYKNKWNTSGFIIPIRREEEGQIEHHWIEMYFPKTYYDCKVIKSGQYMPLHPTTPKKCILVHNWELPKTIPF
jgi:hypothetical protein